LITSVTSATLAATSAAAGWGAVLSAGGVLVVLGLLAALELLGTAHTRFHDGLRRALRVAIAPMLVVFAISVSVRIVGVLAAA
jgi:hypothetical protein